MEEYLKATREFNASIRKFAIGCRVFCAIYATLLVLAALTACGGEYDLPPCPQGYTDDGTGVCIPDCPEGSREWDGRCLEICTLKHLKTNQECAPLCEEGVSHTGPDGTCVPDNPTPPTPSSPTPPLYTNPR